MKPDKLLLSMQSISILPLVLFLFIYTSSDTVYLLLAFVLLGFLGLNIYRYRNKLPLLHYPLLMILIGSFLVYASYGLGSRDAPQSFEILKRGNTVIFDFGKSVHPDKMCYYIGIDQNVNFTVNGIDQKQWKKLYSYKQNFPFSFRWQCSDLNLAVSKIHLYVTKNEMMLGEVYFMDKKRTIPFVTNKPLLNDEQNLTVDTSHYGGMFFDEIYHSRTAYEIMHGMNVYETTHPYLGKFLIIPGIKLFGMTPFGWRVTNVVFAALFIGMMYYFALLIFRKRFFAFSAAFLLTYSFMHLTQSRIGLIDTFGVFFVFVSYYFLYRFIKQQKLSLLLWSGLFFGLASAVKWSAVFASLGFIMIALYLLITRYPLEKRFSGYKLLFYGILSYGVVAVVVYLFTFFDIYLQTGSFQKIIEYQVNMYDYHSRLTGTHAYSSPWWSWPIDFRPMCYTREINGTHFRSVTVFGNPAIFWMGTIAIFYLTYVTIKRRTLESSFILLAFASLYLPYIFVGRSMFIYHFYYAVPFMMLAVIYMLKDAMIRFPQYCKFYFMYLIVVAALFLFFYPVLSGYEVPKMYVDHGLIWFSGWWL
ncbi:MAG: glycosyltransferase family 39 protein [Sulfurovum sp.]|nr:glycosyltransferase family 39 protein [Sulfurovum sp.]